MRSLPLRCSTGTRLIWMRPLFSVVFVPSMPMKLLRLSTALSARITRTSACCRWLIASKLMSWAASLMPRITPVSCTGKNPLGMTSYR